MSDERKTILIADFFGTVKERGIAAYVRDLEKVAEPMARTITLRAPKWVRRQPQLIQNLLMVAHEQLYVPLQALARRPDLIIFPYNTSSFMLALSRRSVCVIHDLIPYKRRNRGSGLAYLYVACSARWHARLQRRFVAVSPFTARTLKAIPRFQRSSVIYIPNCFTSTPTEGVEGADLPAPRRRVTLVSGVGANKAFARALELMARAAREDDLSNLTFDVVGFGPEHGVAAQMIADARQNGVKLPTIVVHALLPRAELDRLFAESSVTWAHSNAEGFGRVVVEGRMAGRPVIMSRLPVFKALRDDFTFDYRNDDSGAFVLALRTALENSDRARRYPLVAQLQADAAEGIEELLDQ